MASSSTYTGNNTLKPSRFSTLKVFKFSRDKDNSKPPPLPPKDPYYLYNRSLASLTPESVSLPATPLSPPYQYQYANRSPDPSNSTMSLVSSAASSPADVNTHKKDKSSKGSGFFKFAKRSPRSPSPVKSPAVEESQKSPVSADDDNISMPWNFQHHIHVDEGYVGLPPSWSSSLIEHGFSEEEIAAIQARRTAGTRSPHSQSLYTDRPRSPATTISSTHTNGAPVLTRPTPRTTSLPRQGSLASIPGQIPHRPPLPGTQTSSPSKASLLSNTNNTNTPNKTTRLRKFSDDSTRHGSSSSLCLSTSAESDLSQELNTTLDPSAPHNLGPPAVVSSPAVADIGTPTTPPKRTFHVTNGPPPILSPPPAYSNSSSHGYPRDEKDRSLFEPNSNSDSNTPTPNLKSTFHRPPSSTETAHTRTDTSSSSASGSTPSEKSFASSQSQNSTSQRRRRSKRFTALPPRLSLYKDDGTDLSSWTQALISAIPSELSGSSREHTPSSSKFSTAQDSMLSPSRSPSGKSQKPPSGESAIGSAGLLSSTSQVSTARPLSPQKIQSPTRRPPPPTRPVPPIVMPADGDGDDEGDEPSSAWAEPSTSARSLWDEPSTANSLTAAWNDLAGMVGGNMSSPEMFTPALSEHYSPTLPFTPESGKGRDREGNIDARFTVSAYGERLSVGEEEEKDEVSDESRLSLLSVESAATQRGPNRDSGASTSTISSISTVSTITATGLTVTTGATIVRNASFARRAVANVIDKSKPVVGFRERERERERQRLLGKDQNHAVSLHPPHSPKTEPTLGVTPVVLGEVKHPGSPQSSHFGSEDSSASGSASGGSGSSSSQSQDDQTSMTEETEMESPLLQFLETSPKPSQTTFIANSRHDLLVSTTDTFGGVHKEDEDEDEEVPGHGSVTSTETVDQLAQRPTIVISEPSIQVRPGPLSVVSPDLSPMTPSPRYRGWMSEVVAPLGEFIDDAIDPRDYYVDLQEIAEGESGSVYAASLVETNAHKLKLPPLVKARDSDNISKGRQTLVAIKNVPILPSGSPKLIDLQRELTLTRGVWHDNVLGMDALYVDLVDDSLWIRMELMERSLADVISLVEEGLMLQDRMIARFASDVLLALEYLQKQHIAHRDVRSDNLLLNSHGVLKLTDFSNAVQVTPASPLLSDPVGVIYWQAPEVRSGPYNALKVDVWSLGATVWEMAQAEPPFANTQQVGDRWPTLSKPEIYSPAFHDFLQLCSEPAVTRPNPSELTKSSFIQNACGRPVIIQLLAQCVAIEKRLQEGEDQQGPNSSS